MRSGPIELAKSDGGYTDAIALTFWRRSWLVVLVAMMVLSACDLPPPEGAVEVPCDGDEGTVLELGPAGRSGGRYGHFSTTGAAVWVTAGPLDQGGIFDTDVTNIEVGWASEPPEYDGRTGEENANVVAQTSVKEGYWSPLELEAGDYWLWSSNGGEVTVQACMRGAIFDAIPAIRQSPLMTVIEGTWQVTAIELAGTEETVTPGVNAVSPPWIAVEGGEIAGVAGCNGIRGPFTVSDDGKFSMAEVVMEATFCGPEDGSLMQADSVFQAVMWDGTLVVSLEGGEMIWSNGNNSITFVYIDSPPITQPVTPPALSQLGRLDCSPGFVSETRVSDTGQDPIDIARETDASVVSIKPGEPLWYSGVDSEGNVIVEMALGDVAGAAYQVWTCED